MSPMILGQGPTLLRKKSPRTLCREALRLTFDRGHRDGLWPSPEDGWLTAEEVAADAEVSVRTARRALNKDVAVERRMVDGKRCVWRWPEKCSFCGAPTVHTLSVGAICDNEPCWTDPEK